MARRQAGARSNQDAVRYVALLRGINVGRAKRIAMGDLRAVVERLGFTEVRTLLNSGNVVFTGATAKPQEIATRIVLLSRGQLARIIASAPRGFGAQPGKYRYDVIFLRDPLRAASALKSVPLCPGVDEACGGPGALYFRRLIAGASRSRLARIVSLPIYQHMTIRNWNTTTRLLGLMEAAAPATP